MNHAHSAQETTQTTASGSSPDASAGPDALALAPPACGIDLVDQAAEAAAPGLDGTLQMKAAPPPAGSDAGLQAENRTGLPDPLKAGVESLSGLSLDDVQVHYNSPRPAQLQALAYTQGTDIYVGPGQQRHLPHEAWHVVQQKQGRVQPTVQTKGVAINDQQELEREADAMGIQALQRKRATPAALKIEPAQQASKTVVQGVWDWARDAAYNRRKVGVEITEDRTGRNGITEVEPTATWTALAGGDKDTLWGAATVDLPDATGATHTWRVVASGTMIPTYFATTNGNKNVWMKWDSVLLTEDYGDFEWIIRHPSEPKGITHYRDQLANVNTARQALREALGALPIVGNEYIVALNTDPALGQVFYINLQDINAASSQITFESSDPGQTKKGLMEGLTHGLNKTEVPNRASLVDPDEEIATTVSTAAGRVVTGLDVDMELIMAFIIGDLCHKMATLISGVGWAGSVAANFKQWRTLFPKSHPSQIMFQAMSSDLTLGNINTLNTDIVAQRAAIIDDITGLFAGKMRDRTVHTTWDATSFTAASDPLDEVFTALMTGALPGGGIGALQTALATFFTQNGVDLTTEFNNALAALTDYTGAAIDVVRSTGFATHTGSNKGFAFEDRAEVETEFPDLATTYARIKAIVSRY